MSQQQFFCDILNNNHSQATEGVVSTAVPLSGQWPVSFSFQPYQITKRRLSDVAWSQTMEVSEEKRFKMKKNEQ